MRIPKEQITGLILAGGLGSRMGGIDKGLQPVGGAPMVTLVMQRLQPQVDAVLINANRHTDHYATFGVPVVSDLIEGYAGPLAGIHAGLSHCDTDYLVSAPCDSPLLPHDLVQRLAEALNDTRADAAVAVTGQSETLQRHPVFMLLRCSLRDRLASYLNEGGRKVDGWLKSLHCIEVRFDDEAAFANVNTPEELNALANR